jgi:hypothetical protein
MTRELRTQQTFFHPGSDFFAIPDTDAPAIRSLLILETDTPVRIGG